MTKHESQEHNIVPKREIVAYGRYYAFLEITNALGAMLQRRSVRRKEGEKSFISKAVEIVRFPKRIK